MSKAEGPTVQGASRLRDSNHVDGQAACGSAYAHPETSPAAPAPVHPQTSATAAVVFLTPDLPQGCLAGPHLHSLMVGLRWSEGKVLHAPPAAGVMPPVLRAGPQALSPVSPGSGSYFPETSPPLWKGCVPGARPWG